MNKFIIKNKFLLWLIPILIFALVLRLYFFVGFSCCDDSGYVNSAKMISDGHWQITGIYDSRIAMVYPIAFFYLVFGVSDFSTAMYFLLISMGTIIVTYYLGKIIFNEIVGLIAAFLLSIHPLFVVSASMLVNDILLAFYMSLSVYFFIKGEKYGKVRNYILSGIFYGIAFLVKSSAIFFALVFFIYYLFNDFLGFNFFDKRNIRKNHSIKKIIGFLIFGLLLVLFFMSLLIPKIFNFITKYDYYYAYCYGNKLYEPGIAWLDEYEKTRKCIYWDIDTNQYANDVSRDILKDFSADMAFSNPCVGCIRSLSPERPIVRESMPYVHGLQFQNLAEIKNPSDKCSKANYTLVEIPVKEGDDICVKTDGGNFVKLHIFFINETRIGIKYEIEGM